MKNTLKLLLSILLIALTCCSSTHLNIKNRSANYRKLISKNNNKFAINLYKQLANKENRNVFFSPFSIYVALSMIYNGAKNSTKQQMQKVLNFYVPKNKLPYAFKNILNNLQTNNSKLYILDIANAIWIQKNFHIDKTFTQTIYNYYDSQLFIEDFKKHKYQTINSINQWVSKKTNKKIQKLILSEDISPFTRLLITNAIYFKGNWASKFKKKHTKTGKFYISNNRYVTIPIMYQEGNFDYLDLRNLQIISLPYVGNKISMLIILPKQKMGIYNIEKILTASSLTYWLSHLHKRQVHLYLPRFKLNDRYYLKSILSRLGMPDAFTNKADFPGITGKKNLKISKIIHQAYIKVNENGTEATAATAVVSKLTCVFMPTIFRADHPFIFLIIYRKMHTILFIGRLINPDLK